MTTKDQERQAIEKIRKIVEGLGENSYVGFAMDGILELAEDNIREDSDSTERRNKGERRTNSEKNFIRHSRRVHHAACERMVLHRRKEP